MTGYTAGATCTATESPIPLGYSSTGTCADTIVGAPSGTGACTITNTLNSATFTVHKDFVPNNGSGVVTVTLTCTSGSPDTLSKPATEAVPAVFTVTGYTAGATCSATEGTAPAGYTKNETDCQAVALVTDGDCTITNTLNPPPTIAFVKVVGTATHSTGFFGTLVVPCPQVAWRRATASSSRCLPVATQAPSLAPTPKSTRNSLDVQAGGGGVPRSAIVSAHNVIALGSTDTITCSFPTSSTGSAMSVNEFSGLAVAPLDKVASNAGTSAPELGLDRDDDASQRTGVRLRAVGRVDACNVWQQPV